MTTLLLTHEDCATHDPGPGHVECPGRLQSVWAALEATRFAGLLRHDAPLADRDSVARVHPRRHVDALLDAVPREGWARIDSDTVLSPGSGHASLRAAGAVVAGVDAVFGGVAQNVFCAVRPPGHHAEPQRAMGFCLFNSVAIGAMHARAIYGAQRCAIVDFDVHHGNGSQVVAEHDADLFYASTHQWPLYPGTGPAHETGLGNVVNVPLGAGTSGVTFRQHFSDRIMPALTDFAPDLLLISAGFDAHAADPLGGLRLVEADFAWVTEILTRFAAKQCSGRIVSVLEGGYDLAALGASAAAHVEVLMAA